MKKLLTFVVLVSLAGVAVAGDPPSAQTRNPPVYVHEPWTYVYLLNGGSDGWQFHLVAHVFGWKEGDRVRVDVTQASKKLGSMKCYVGREEVYVDPSGNVDCVYADKPIKAKGNVNFDLIYEDDQTDKDFLIRRYSTNVVQWPDGQLQLAPDDLLGIAYAETKAIGGGEPLNLIFWATNVVPSTDGMLRCTVDGKSLPDREGGLTTHNSDISVSVIPKKGPSQTWHWSQLVFEPKWSNTGPKPANASKDYLYFIDHPGKWACQLRVAGRAIRTFAFTINNEGRVAPHPMQSAPGAYPLHQSMAIVEIGIPKDAAFDERIKPDVIRKSRGWGMPWPNDPSVKAMLASLPPAVESAEIKVPATKPGAGGKRLAGTEHTPKRFIDEATTEVKIQRNSDGYTLNVYAEISGWTAKSDRVKLEWKSGGKLLVDVECGISGKVATGIAFVGCHSGDKPVMAKGPIEANLVYYDDVDGNQYLLRTYKVTAAKFPSSGDAVWQILADDTLATAYAFQNDADMLDVYGQHLQFYLWHTRDEATSDFNLRCTVDGKKIPDVKAGIGSDAPGMMRLEAEPTNNGKRVKYNWVHLMLDTQFHWGKKENFKNQGDYFWLGDHPGAYDCILRESGKPIRQLLFTVDAKGEVVGDPEQPGEYLPWIKPIDLRIPKESTWDGRVRSDAMKKTRGFGLPWAKPPTKPMPATSGLPDPK